MCQRVGVLPSFPEHGLRVTDRGSADRHLDVVPGGPRAVRRGHRESLWIAAVLDVVASAVAQVDAADEGDVVLGPVAVPKHHQLLVVRAEAADAHVEEALATGLVDRLAELAVLLGAKAEAAEVRAPQQPADVGASPRGCREDSATSVPGPSSK